MIQIILLVLAWLFGMVLMGKGKQITIDRKNKVITQLKQDRTNLLSEVDQYKNVQKITESASTTSVAITDLKQKVIAQVDSIPEEPEPLQESASEDREDSEDEEPQTEEEDNEKKVYVLAADQSARTNRIADLLY
ncbi:hypothetical protein [Sphaerochaeta sp.]|uniref:hypothetical protein n=1 Tax=Sphaerochaeta sp. TaxID=1972642 RepID=UPI002FCCADE4